MLKYYCNNFNFSLASDSSIVVVALPVAVVANLLFSVLSGAARFTVNSLYC